MPGNPNQAAEPEAPSVRAGRFTTGEVIQSTVCLPDAAGLLALKAGARRVRNEDRDASDLWKCLEIAYADGLRPNLSP